MAVVGAFEGWSLLELKVVEDADGQIDLTQLPAVAERVREVEGPGQNM